MTTFVRFTNEEIQFLVDNYAEMTTKEISEILGCSQSRVFSKAYELGLKKSAERIRKNARIRRANQPRLTSEKCLKNLVNGWKGLKELKSDAEIKEIAERRRNSLKQTYKLERMREAYGMQRKTNLIINFATIKKRDTIYRLMKCGYVEVSKNMFAVPEHRHAIMERNATNKHGIIFIEE